MKKWKSAFLAFVFGAGAFLLASCSWNVEESVKDEKYGYLTFGANAKFLDASEITNATVKVYGWGMTAITKENVSVSGGSGKASIDKIPVGKNRVIEITGYKDSSKTVPVKILYKVLDIKTGTNTVDTIKDSSDSAKGKAYLALLNAGVNITNVDLGDFSGVSSAYLFDSESFATAYKADSSVKASSYIQTIGSVNFTNISNASGYTIWIDDPLSEKVTISGTETSASAKGVAPGTWNVYVNDGTFTKKVGGVTVKSGSPATYSGLVGNALAGKTIIFVNVDADTIYAWYDGTETALNGAYPGKAFTSEDCSAYMNDATGWKMLDISSVYDKSKGSIDFLLIKNGSKTTSDDIKSGKKATFWYDGSSFYDADPTTAPVLDSDATLSDIKVNDDSVGVVSEYSVPYKTSSVTISATATSSKASVTVSPSAATTLTVGTAKYFTIKVTAQDGTEKSYTISVTRNAGLANDVTLSAIKVNGSSIGTLSGTSFTKSLTGSEDSMSVTVTAEANSSKAKVVVSGAQTVSDGSSKTFTISVTNGTGSATYTVTVSYTKKEANQYYWTNKNGAVGANKTISSFSDWTESMKIAQGAVNDDPRVFAHWSMHENPNDAYALFAAYDDKNLYLMVELPNVQDIVAPGEDYPKSDEGQYWNRGTPFFFAFETGKGTAGDGSMVDGTYVWGSQVQFSNKNVDTMIVCHSNPSRGTPGLFRTNSSGLFDYENGLCEKFTANGVTVTWDGGANKTQGLVSKNLYGIKACGTDQGRLAKNILTDTYVDFNTLGHNKDLDLKWQITIPLSALKISKSELESSGIGVMFVLSDGGSGMDCLPWDETMIDNAATPYSKDKSTSAEKEDLDVIKASFARIGHM